MRRALITLTVTAAGTAAVLAYSPLTQQAATLATSGGASAQAPSSSDSSSSGSSSSGSSTSTDTVTGTAYQTRWGTVQVQLTFEGDQIVDVQAVAMPDADEHSMMLSQRAATVLAQEVLQAQSANVDMISGATFTSQGYLQSVQSALDAHGA